MRIISRCNSLQRQDYMFREMLEIERKCVTKNIVVARGDGLRHASIWGGASLLTTLLTSANEMLARDRNWDFLVNLSESDFPVKSDARLTEFLTLNKGMNFVKSHGREVQRFITKQGLDKSFVECEARMWRIGDRKFPTGNSSRNPLSYNSTNFSLSPLQAFKWTEAAIGSL